MILSNEIKEIIKNYEADPISVKLNLARMMMHGKLGGTGKIILMAVDQGFEHGPTTFLKNERAFDPHYHFEFAAESGISAYTGPLSWLQSGAESFLGSVPLILKLNHSSKLFPKGTDPNQAIVASVSDAVNLGCVGVGYTIYPGSSEFLNQIENLAVIISEAKSSGLFTVVWAYPRGSGLNFSSNFDGNASNYEENLKMQSNAQTALDVVAYATHMASLLGAHVIKVNLPTEMIANESSKIAYENVPKSSASERVKHITEVAFAGKRLVIFSGGATKSKESVIDDAKSVKAGGGSGSIIGRNIFQRKKIEAIELVEKLINVYSS